MKATENARFFSATLRRDMPTLDLHSVGAGKALDALELFLYNVYTRKEREVRVVYGIGTGTLGGVVKNYLQKHQLVVTIIEEPGSCIAFMD